MPTFSHDRAGGLHIDPSPVDEEWQISQMRRIYVMRG
jgi:hypothetical protein